MIFTKPTKRFEKKAGFTESYHLDTENVSFDVNTIIGGWDAYSPAKDEKFVYVLRGLGKVFLGEGEKEFDVEGGERVDIPERTSHTLRGQLKYVLTYGMGDFKIDNNEGLKEFGPSDKSRFIYIIDGLASVVIDGERDVVRENYLVEVPAGVNFSLEGKVNYITATAL